MNSIKCKICGTLVDADLSGECPQCHITLGFLACPDCGAVYDPMLQPNPAEAKCPLCAEPAGNWQDKNFCLKDQMETSSSLSSSEGDNTFSMERVQCTKNPDHYYLSTKSRCPFCAHSSSSSSSSSAKKPVNPPVDPTDPWDPWGPSDSLPCWSDSSSESSSLSESSSESSLSESSESSSSESSSSERSSSSESSSSSELSSSSEYLPSVSSESSSSAPPESSSSSEPSESSLVSSSEVSSSEMPSSSELSSSSESSLSESSSLSSSGDPDNPPPVDEGPESDSSCANSCSDSCSSSSGCCEGGSMGSVQMNIAFGRFPGFPGMPAGMLALHSTLIDPSLVDSGAFSFDHVTSRTIAVNPWRRSSGGSEGDYAVGIKTPTGRARFSIFSEANGGGLTVSKEGGSRFSESLMALDADKQPLSSLQTPPAYFKETLEDGTQMLYEAEDGTFHSLVLPNGVSMTRGQLAQELHIIKEPDTYTMNSVQGETVNSGLMMEQARTAEIINEAVREASADPRSFSQVKKGRLLQIWNRTDGLLDFMHLDSGYVIRQYVPADIAGFDSETRRYTLRDNAVPVKSWTITTGSLIPASQQLSWDGGSYQSPAYLKFFRVEEVSGGVAQSYRWNQLDGSRLLFVKGVGPTAELTLKIRTDLSNSKNEAYGGKNDLGGVKNALEAKSFGRSARSAAIEMACGIADSPFMSRTGQSMGVNGVPSTRIRMTTSKYKGESYTAEGIPNGILSSCTEEIYQGFDFGSVLVEKTEGKGMESPQVTKYGYGATGGSKGRCIRELRPDGSAISREYDSSGRLSTETTPWAGGGTQTIGYTYYNERFNDQRIRTRTVTITKDGTDTLLTSETYEIEETSTSRHTTVTRTGLGAEHPLVSEQKLCIDNGNPVAKGRVTWEKNETGIETWYTYTPVEETDPVQTTVTWADLWYKSTAETRVAGQVVPGKSSRQEIWYSKTDKPALIRQYVHTGENFTLVDQEEREYDHKDRLIRTKSALGTRTTEWNCRGPVTETDENLVLTQYEYNTAGRLSKKTRHATPHTCQIDGHAIPTVNLPATVTEHTYNGDGQAVTTKVTRGAMIRNESRVYDRLGRLISSTDAMGKLTSHAYSSDGLTETITHPVGYTLVTQYHADGNPLKESGSGRPARFYSYNLTVNGIQTSIRSNSPEGSLLETIVENGLGQIVEEKSAGGNETWITSHYFYNDHGLLIRKNETGRAPVIKTYDGFGQIEREALWLDETRPVNTSQDRVKDHSWSYAPVSVSDLGIQNIPMMNIEEKTYSAGGSPIVRKEQNALVPLYNEARSCQLDTLAVSTDIRGNKTLIWKENHAGNKLNVMKWPGTEQLQCQLVVDGKTIADKGRDGVIRHFNYEFSATGEKTIGTDGRGNTHTETFNLLNDKISIIEGGATTSFVYENTTGLLNHLTQADGSTVEYSYDTRGRKTSESGTAAYPIRYEYDDENRLVKMHSYRAEPAPGNMGEGDTTQWIYYSISGLLMEKRYPDGHGTVYQYNDLGRVAQVQKGRAGVRADYNYVPLTGEISTITYSDGTPSSECTYNHLGQPVSISDASGTKTFRYNSLGEGEGEDTQLAQTGVNSSLTYTRDSRGRLNGHMLSMNGTLIHSENLDFDQADRVTGMLIDNDIRHTFTYRQDRGWLDTLNYASGMRKKMVYDETRDEIAETGYYLGMQNLPLSRRSMTRDSFGRPVEQTEQRKDQQNRTQEYTYNYRGELTDNLVTGRENRHDTYGYDAIGNRLFKNDDTVYQTNLNNQYTLIKETNPGTGAAVNSFEPSYDLDGNQTGIRTSTGEWQVEYNAENRPVCFTQGNRRIRCQYDYMGRRTMKSVYDGTNLIERKSFLYKGFLQIAELDTTHSGSGQSGQPCVLRTTWWDPTEEVETRPLTMARWTPDGKTYCDYTHTLNKDVSELVDANGSIQAAYDYDSFGNIVSQSGPLAGQNFFRYSSEYHDEELGLVYYNYRHYNPKDGRWIGRDPIEESGGLNLYAFLMNQAVNATDYLGNIEHWHHMVPTQVYENHRDKFPAGFDPNSKENGWILDDMDHNRKGGIHPDGWNKDYDNWAKDKKDITLDDIAKKNRNMMEKYPEVFSRGKPADFSYDETKNIRKKMAKKAVNQTAEKVSKICGKKLATSVPVVGWAVSVVFVINDLDDPNISTQDAIVSNIPYVGIPYDIANALVNYLVDQYEPPQKSPYDAMTRPFYDQANPFFNLH